MSSYTASPRRHNTSFDYTGGMRGFLATSVAYWMITHIIERATTRQHSLKLASSQLPFLCYFSLCIHIIKSQHISRFSFRSIIEMRRRARCTLATLCYEAAAATSRAQNRL